MAKAFYTSLLQVHTVLQVITSYSGTRNYVMFTVGGHMSLRLARTASHVVTRARPASQVITSCLICLITGHYAMPAQRHTSICHVDIASHTTTPC